MAMSSQEYAERVIDTEYGCYEYWLTLQKPGHKHHSIAFVTLFCPMDMPSSLARQGL